MPSSFVIEISRAGQNDLVTFLEQHEVEIALDIEDYSDLRDIFIAVMNRTPTDE